MKIFKSIKWRLQIWYGLILVTVLAGFGVTAYQFERSRLFRRVDDEIHRRIGVLAKSMHGPPHRGRPEDSPGDFPPPGQFGPGDGPPDQERRPPQFTLTPEIAALFDASDPDNFFFIIRQRDGRNISHSDNVPATGNYDAFFNQADHPDNPTTKDGPPPPAGLGHNRLFMQELPSGEQILVGASIVPEEHELKLVAARFTAVGGVILVFGLLGGWGFVGRALRPIAQITGTAAGISRGDLSQRINVTEAESELGQLATVLNSTFARLETAFGQQKQFASDAAHELRTPVSVILTQTQLALGRERDAASYKQTLEACQRAAQRMRRLIESLLELARFDAGQESLKRARFDLAHTIADCAELVNPLAAERDVKIITELTPQTVIGDPERLAQVVTNLLTNAIQYNVPEGVVNVKLAGENGLAVLTIADTGRGIPRSDLPRVFERFYRAEKSRTGSGNAGLGLAICQAIVAAHGGTIEVFSEEGAGTTFTLRLPIGSDE